MSKIIALDTNVLVYIIDSSDITKRKIAEKIVNDSPYISFQVISEFINVSKRILKYDKLEILQDCNSLLSVCSFIPPTVSILRKAETLIKTHNFQLFDAIIVASALEANCDLMYSEDMHHNLMIENKLHIVNPFI